MPDEPPVTSALRMQANLEENGPTAPKLALQFLSLE
jgi:hypothetical protein